MSNKKRKKVVVSMEQKFQALQRLDRGESVRIVAQEYGVSRVTVGDWKKKKSQIERWCSTRHSEECLRKRKTMKKCGSEELNKALFVWFTQQRTQGIQVTGPLLQEMALVLNKKFNEGDSNFTASTGWLDRWKQRYGVKQSDMRGEKLCVGSKPFPRYEDQIHFLVKNETQEWMDQDEEQQLTSNVIAELANHVNEKNLLRGSEEAAERSSISHDEGFAAIEITLRYIEQQQEAGVTDILVLRHWLQLAAEKRKNAYKQVPITHFLKK